MEPGFLSLGQAHALEAARSAATAGRLQRTVLVHGPPGAGKGAFVDDLLALLLCRDASPQRRPCNGCRGCRDARSRSHPDLLIGSPRQWREARSTGESIVGVARRWLLEGAGTPIAGERRVILIEELDQANEQTQNALLKALEEPSARQMFVLVAADLGRVLPTVLSRSQLLRVGAVSRTELVEWLVDRERLPADQAETLARLADGLAGRAIGYAKHPERVEWQRRTQAELLGLLERGNADRFGSVRDLLDQAAPGAPVQLPEPGPVVGSADDTPRAATTTSGAVQRTTAVRVLDAWQALARDLLVAALGRSSTAPSAQLLPDLERMATSVDPESIISFVHVLDRVREGLLQNAAPRLALEVALLSWPSAGSAAERNPTARWAASAGPS